MRLRRLLRTVLLTSAAGALVVGTAAPGLAGGDRKTYSATVRTAGGVAGSGAGQLDDVVSGTASDRLWAMPTKAAPLSVTPPDGITRTCKSSSVEVYGQSKDWSNAADAASPVRGILRADCTYADGSKRRFFWGAEHYGTWSFRNFTHCIRISRATSALTTTYTVTTEWDVNNPCLVQEQHLDNAGNVLYSTGSEPGQPPLLPMPVIATFTVSGKVSNAIRP